MKRIFAFVLISSFLYSFSTYSQSKMLEKGFSIKFSFGFPPTEYGYDGDIALPDELIVNTTYGLELGNQWYFHTGEQFGIGLDVNWIDVVYSGAKMDVPQDDPVRRYTLEGSFLEFGPVATFAVNDIFALEGHYNLRPSYLATWYVENVDDNLVIHDFAFLHGVGIGARIKFIYIGYEYTFGSVDGKVKGWGELQDYADQLDRQTMIGKNSKLIIGFQF